MNTGVSFILADEDDRHYSVVRSPLDFLSGSNISSAVLSHDLHPDYRTSVDHFVRCESAPPAVQNPGSFSHFDI